jgi:hypothetical protein
MTNTIDLRTIPANIPSLCIPRTFPNINQCRILDVFESLDMGEIDHIDIVQKKTEKGEKFKCVFIHWKRWNVGGNADIARERLLNGKEIKIVYDDPLFWKVSAYREPISKPRANRVNTSVPRLLTDSDEDKYTKKTKISDKKIQNYKPRSPDSLPTAPPSEIK